MTILGFQVVLLDEQGVELQRIPDVYYDDASIVLDERDYGLIGAKLEEGQRVRYFQRVPEGLPGLLDYRQDIVANVASDSELMKTATNGVWISGHPEKLFGYPIVYTEVADLAGGDVTFGPADENWARRYFGLPPKES
jgi:hypothetical protein